MMRQMMRQLQLEEGEIIKVVNVNLPRGKFVKIQPQSVDFLDITDPRAVCDLSLGGNG
jgi:ubiquitin fusion degradation protein 1